MKKLLALCFFLQSFLMIGQQWETVVSLPGRSPVKQIEIVNDNHIIVSSQYYKLHKWDGTSWESIGNFSPNFNGIFKYVSDDLIYATHNQDLTHNNTGNDNYIAKWDGTSWTSFGNFNQPKPIYNFKILSDTEAYAVGAFDDLDGFRWRSVAKYNGTSWNVVGLNDSKAGTYSESNSLWVNNENDIYSKHDHYRDAGPQKVKHWDGTSWTVLASNNDEIVGVDKIHVVSENEIYINTWNTNRDYGVIGKWDGNYWRILGDLQTDLNTGGFYGSTDFLFVSSNEIYAFGSALRKRHENTYQVAVWNGTKWSNLGNLNANNPVLAAFYKDGFLYVSGSFTESGKTLIKKINAQQVLSTQENTLEKTFSIYPNPTKGISQFNKTFKSITIFDATGKELYTENNSNSFNISDFSKGIYILKVEDFEGNTSIRKIIKQ